jgi:CRP/FNR family transcriptional regulator
MICGLVTIDAVDVLARVPLLQGLGQKDLERLAKSFREREFREGHVVTAEGEPGVGFFVIVEGAANVSVGGEQKGTLSPGDAFGEMALIDEGPRSATVVAATDLRCLALSAWEFRPFVMDHPEIAWALLQTLARRLRAVEG